MKGSGVAHSMLGSRQDFGPRDFRILLLHIQVKLPPFCFHSRLIRHSFPIVTHGMKIAFSHEVTSAMLVSENDTTAAMLVF